MGKTSNFFIFAFLFFVTLMLGRSMGVEAAAYDTYTMSPEGIVETQTAYEAYSIIQYPAFQKIEDLFLDSNDLYVVDSEAKKIFVMDLEGNVKREVFSEEFGKPTGLAVDLDKRLYVADPEKEKVFCFSPEGMLEKSFSRPTEPLFGKSAPYKPAKLSVDVRGNLYIVGEGSVNGLIQLNRSGEFLGYFGAATTTQSAFEKLKNTILSEIQLEKMIQTVPIAPSNVGIDHRGLIYTVTNQNTGNHSIQKLNIAGRNLFEADFSVGGGVSLAVGNYENLYILSNSGAIVEYSGAGDFLFGFAANQKDAQRLGIFRKPVSIAVDKQDVLYVADAENKVIQKFRPTDLAKTVHEGIKFLEDGKYVEGKKYWENVLSLNSSFKSAYIGVGEAFLKEEKYNQALQYFKIANLKVGYSNAFWELRQEWMNRHLGLVLIILFAISLGIYVFNRINRKTHFWTRRREKWRNQLLQNNEIESFFLFFKIFRHPIDTFYAIKKERKGSWFVASFFYILAFVEFIYFQYGVGFLFNLKLYQTIGIVILSLVFVGGLLLFLTMNYLMASINEGEGRFGDLYVGMIYSAAPLIVMIVPIIFISNALTLNESFVYSFSLLVAISWTVIHLVIMIKELHNFSAGEVVKNIFLTLFGMIVFIAIAYIIFILFDQVIDFVVQIFQEVSSFV